MAYQVEDTCDYNKATYLDDKTSRIPIFRIKQKAWMTHQVEDTCLQ